MLSPAIWSARTVTTTRPGLAVAAASSRQNSRDHRRRVATQEQVLELVDHAARLRPAHRPARRPSAPTGSAPGTTITGRRPARAQAAATPARPASSCRRPTALRSRGTASTAGGPGTRATSSAGRRTARRRRSRRPPARGTGTPPWAAGGLGGAAMAGSCWSTCRSRPVELGPRVDAQLVGEEPPGVAQRAQGVALPTAAVLREREDRPPPLPQRVLGHAGSAPRSPPGDAPPPRGARRAGPPGRSARSSVSRATSLAAPAQPSRSANGLPTPQGSVRA